MFNSLSTATHCHFLPDFQIRRRISSCWLSLSLVLTTTQSTGRMYAPLTIDTMDKSFSDSYQRYTLGSEDGEFEMVCLCRSYSVAHYVCYEGCYVPHLRTSKSATEWRASKRMRKRGDTRCTPGRSLGMPKSTMVAVSCDGITTAKGVFCSIAKLIDILIGSTAVLSIGNASVRLRRVRRSRWRKDHREDSQYTNSRFSGTMQLEHESTCQIKWVCIVHRR